MFVPLLAGWATPIVFVTALALPIVLVVLNTRSRDRARRRRDAFFSAAADPEDSTRLDEFLQSGFPIDTRDAGGNTALHLASYAQQEEVVRRLIARGADQTLVTKAGYTADDLSKIASYERMLPRTARRLTPEGAWADPGPAARAGFGQLRRADDRLFWPALERAFADNRSDRRLLIVLMVKLGRPGSEESLLAHLRTSRDLQLAEDLLNCGSGTLVDGVERWARANNCTIRWYGGSARPIRWGRF
ncbi:ankyrin repeat domain-containing protein [Kribbella sp. NPDC058245]|uniref:ankyrin repeat domain-containing protein n=1 Tax=Kribbella sp. NPDC058245 TaxID=3346399 RepID=UPI0036E8613B